MTISKKATLPPNNDKYDGRLAPWPKVCGQGFEGSRGLGRQVDSTAATTGAAWIVWLQFTPQPICKCRLACITCILKGILMGILKGIHMGILKGMGLVNQAGNFICRASTYTHPQEHPLALACTLNLVPESRLKYRPKASTQGFNPARPPTHRWLRTQVHPCTAIDALLLSSPCRPTSAFANRHDRAAGLYA